MQLPLLWQCSYVLAGVSDIYRSKLYLQLTIIIPDNLVLNVLVLDVPSAADVGKLQRLAECRNCLGASDACNALQRPTAVYICSFPSASSFYCASCCAVFFIKSPRLLHFKSD